MPAIQRIDDAGGEFGRGEMENGISHFFGFADPAKKMQFGQDIGVLNAVSLVHRRPDDAWRHGVDADIVLGELGRQLDRERMNGALDGNRRRGGDAADGALKKSLWMSSVRVQVNFTGTPA